MRSKNGEHRKCSLLLICEKKWRDGGGGHWLVRMEWRPAGWSVCLPLLIFPCTIKSRRSLLAPAHLGGPGKRAVKRLWYVCGVLICEGSPDTIINNNHHWTAVYQMNVDQPVPSQLSSSTCPGSEPLWINSTRWHSCHRTNSVKALQETQSTDHNQRPGLSRSLSTIRLLMAGTLLH